VGSPYAESRPAAPGPSAGPAGMLRGATGLPREQEWDGGVCRAGLSPPRAHHERRCKLGGTGGNTGDAGSAHPGSSAW